MVIPILQKGKSRHREVRQLAKVTRPVAKQGLEQVILGTSCH